MADETWNRLMDSGGLPEDHQDWLEDEGEGGESQSSGTATKTTSRGGETSGNSRSNRRRDASSIGKEGFIPEDRRAPVVDRKNNNQT